ncbi:MAG: hypothetical protein M4579_000778 [Chaenotheca gracillima]|nr:MAG: hypothetical protein M4579_000778 [Chaenotheca gracillima]
MGRLPDVVFVVRHGARLDAADDQWHLTSGTPYDTPLTYGGWTQSRALGARIASLLQAREAINVNTPTTVNGDGAKPQSAPMINGHVRRKKHRVIIHTSPFVRCVQTSIGISAGMGQYHGLAKKVHQVQAPRVTHTNHVPSTLSSVQETENLPNGEAAPRKPENTNFQKIPLRVDACLGEWLNPDYFETITPPPSSPMMVVGAKADLLRPGDYDEEVIVTSAKASTPFPGGWGNTESAKTEASEGPLSSMSSIGLSLPRRDRSSSHSSVDRRSSSKSNKLASIKEADNGAYVPPTPTYAISASDPVPAGYVSHARDACIDVDYQWDSMRSPHNWGTGGDYGEEWGAMHKRCRGALQKMLSWYRDNDRGDELKPAAALEGRETSKSNDESEEAETETVLILVSHGAICNAIIGGLTDRAVLLDVGMASLTMAVRKEKRDQEVEITKGSSQHARSMSDRQRASVSIPISNDYDVKLMASTEHLRAGSNPLAIPQLQTPRIPSPSVQAMRNRLGSDASHLEGAFTLGDSAYRSSMSSAIGSVRRSSYGGLPHQHKTSPAAHTQSSLGGLWHRREAHDTESEEGSEDSLMLNFGDSEQSKSPKTIEPPVDQFPTFHPPPNPRPGLWGSIGSSNDVKDNEPGLMRRWTVTEASRKRGA